MDELFFLAGGMSANLSIGWMGNPPQAPANVVRIFTRHGHTVTPLPRHDTVVIRGCALVLIDCSSLSFDAVQDHVAHMSVAQPERRHHRHDRPQNSLLHRKLHYKPQGQDSHGQ